MYRRGRRTPRNNLRRPSTSRSRSRTAAASIPTADSNNSVGDDSVIIIDDDDNDCTTIDLTSDDSPRHRNNEVIDLTSPSSHDLLDLPIVIGQPTLPRRSPRNRQNITPLISSDSDSEELPELNHSYNRNNHSSSGFVPEFDLSIVTPEKRRVEEASTSSQRLPQESPTSQILVCPVCLDNYKAIKASNRQMFSTVCGHIFCNECIEASIRSQHKCPTCRKKLTLAKTHPIFLG